MQNNISTIYISAGEQSGDYLGATLITELKKHKPNIKFIGMCGEQMQKAGAEKIFDAHELSYVGILESLFALPKIISVWKKIRHYIKKTKPDLLIFIDLPDTHIRLAKFAKKHNIPVFYYVSPQIWAWRYNRIHTLKKYITHMGVLFSFEKKLYEKENIPVTFVGHHLTQKAKITLERGAVYNLLQLDSTKKTIALFPGSRKKELANHLSVIIASAKAIQQKEPNTQFVLVLAPHFDKNKLVLPDFITVTQDNLYNTLSISDAAIAVSGTITLEIGMMGVPLCVIYRSNPLSIFLLKKLVKTPHIGLCNIILEKRIANEFIQEEVNANNISTEILKILNDQVYQTAFREQLLLIREKIENKAGVEMFAKEILGN